MYWRVCRAVVVLRLREERRVECCILEVEDAVVAKRREACPLITAVDGNMANRIGGILLFSCGHFSAESKSADNVWRISQLGKSRAGRHVWRTAHGRIQSSGSCGGPCTARHRIRSSPVPACANTEPSLSTLFLY
ncbi:uncharacterized protein LOC119368940 [Triticum dicoccoides]|uniref:uncharacterized protein LOC119368940 n=1 Tax=Triticum dicoccoides TaxID=85692 RepID=UPI00188FA4C1|nr:uncharacterized protein LOC119368940 [Triticum dicoccoides]